MDDSRTGTKNPFKKSDKYLILFLIISLLLVNAVLNFIFGQSYKKYAKFNINNISTYVWNNGEMDIGNDNNPGLEFPKGSGKTVVYKSGFLWGAKVNGQIRVGGTADRSGLVPGKIRNIEEYNSEKNRVYRIRKDYKTADLSIEAFDENKTIEEIYSQYEKDWNEWPIDDGAPFLDVDGDDVYGEEYDVKGIGSADQTLWFVANDLDTNVTKSFLDSPPIGIEAQVTVWGYNASWLYNNVVYKEYKIINKSENEFKEMYFSIWGDINIGNSNDDYAGCDTLLNLGYVYNSVDYDSVYGYEPPAAGFLLLQSPRDKTKNKHLGMTSFFLDLPDPFDMPGVKYVVETLEYYNAIQGLIKTTGYPILVPSELGGGETKYIFSGDPVEKKGWFEGNTIDPGDRVILLNSGPFEMMPGDTQTIVFAEIVAQGINRLESVKLLKDYARIIKNNCIIEPTSISENNIPQEYTLSQNYPNPFNPTTKIKFTIPYAGDEFRRHGQYASPSFATIKIFDVLGREVKTLFNGEINEGEHEIEFNASNLPSGIYFYTLQVNSKIIDSKKMVLLK